MLPQNSNHYDTNTLDQLQLNAPPSNQNASYIFSALTLTFVIVFSYFRRHNNTKDNNQHICSHGFEKQMPVVVATSSRGLQNVESEYYNQPNSSKCSQCLFGRNICKNFYRYGWKTVRLLHPKHFLMIWPTIYRNAYFNRKALFDLLYQRELYEQKYTGGGEHLSAGLRRTNSVYGIWAWINTSTGSNSMCSDCQQLCFESSRFVSGKRQQLTEKDDDVEDLCTNSVRVNDRETKKSGGNKLHEVQHPECATTVTGSSIFGKFGAFFAPLHDFWWFICLMDWINFSHWSILPLNHFSRNFGRVANRVYRPRIINHILIWFYIKIFNCNLIEAERDKISQYESLGDFFTRKLKSGARPIDQSSNLVSPADGKITAIDVFRGGFLQQIKGVHYSLNYFLGPIFSSSWLKGSNSSSVLVDSLSCGPVHAHCSHLNDILFHQDGSTVLYQCVIYLSPKDYHRFHSPTDWIVHRRRHFPGRLMSVSPKKVSRHSGLFHVNERVVWLGEWSHGFFSMSAVGATNVGSIKCTFESNLHTNKSSWVASWLRKAGNKAVSDIRSRIFMTGNIPSSRSLTNVCETENDVDDGELVLNTSSDEEVTIDMSSEESIDSSESQRDLKIDYQQTSSSFETCDGRILSRFLGSRALSFNDKLFANGGMHLKKGSDFGHFEFGSTIVLVFEGPKGLKFCHDSPVGSQIQVGRKLI